MRDHVRFSIRGCLRHLACLEEEVEELDTEILRRVLCILVKQVVGQARSSSSRGHLLANQTGRAGAIGTAGASSTLMLSASGHTLPLADIRCGSRSGFIVYHLCAQQFTVVY
jgi:hypothetical protein